MSEAAPNGMGNHRGYSPTEARAACTQTLIHYSMRITPQASRGPLASRRTRLKNLMVDHMFEKSLHGANIATCCAVLATAADLTVTGGLATTIGAALSGITLFKKADAKTKDMAKGMASAFDAAIKQSHMSDDRKKVAIQMFAQFPPDEAALAKGNMIPATIAENMRAEVKTTATNPSHQTETALSDYADLIDAVVAPLTVPTDKMEAMLQELLARSDTSGRADKLRNAGITEKTIIELAQRNSAGTDDVEQAWLELQNAMDIAVNVQAEGKQHSNHGDFVDTVLAQVADLAKDGDYTSASATIRDALAQADAQKSRLLTTGAEVAMLDGDTTAAAALLIQKADLDAGGSANVKTLRTLQDHYYEIGRHKGGNLDSILAITLAQKIFPRTKNALEQGAILNDLGMALQTLGEREGRIDRLLQAQNAYVHALRERTRDITPLDWAMTKNNLGAVLNSLGELEKETTRFPKAISAYNEALLEHTPEKDLTKWAMTKNNIGIALRNLGELESDPENLQKATDAHNAVLLKLSCETDPLDWATTQNNLGNAELVLGNLTNDPTRLQRAFDAYSGALDVRTPHEFPVDRAMSQGNLANVEIAFFDTTHRQAHLDNAVQYVNEALSFYSETQASYYVARSHDQLAAIQSRRS